jgi:aminoglycoside 6'-N-acetyltransferase I
MGGRYMDYELVLSSPDDAHVIAHLWPLYQYELSLAGGVAVNAHGLFEDPDIHTYDYAYALDIWWCRPGVLYPFLVRVHGKPAGFAMVGAAPEFAPPGSDYLVHEFFLLRNHWGTGIAASVAADVFRRLPGRGELRVIPENLRAIAFWRKAIGSVTGGRLNEQTHFVDEHRGNAVVFWFESAVR